MQKMCANGWCKQSFEVTEEDRAMLTKLRPTIGGEIFDLPEPTMCFSCRLQRRTAFYNCRSLYKRPCDFTKKNLISIFSPDKPYTVYHKDIWFSDQWDPLQYGRAFDFSRPFFPQFMEFTESVPLQSIAHIGPDNINSDYTNDNYKLKNCFLIFDGEQAEDCYYGHTFVLTKNCVDFVFLYECELCFECVHCQKCYDLSYSRYCINCSSSWFLRDCIGCKDCFGCANLRQKQYCIFNEQKTKVEYEAFLKEWVSDSYAASATMKERTEAFFLTQPVKAVRGEQNVNSLGDNLSECKGSYWCFDCNQQEESRYCTDCLMSSKDSMDIHVWGDNQELCYNCCVIGAGSRGLIGDYYVTQNCTDVLYSLYCSHGCANLFGCVGLRRAQYCIFNKQYTQKEYETLVPRIIRHMQATKEWGEFFPPEFALFGYNETMAHTFFPLTKDECLKRGWQWCDFEAPVEATLVIPADQLPDNGSDVPDDILNWAIICEVSGKPFRIIKQELDFYRHHHVPIPRRHPNQRHRDRFSLKNPFMLFPRECAQCQKPISTSYSPDRPEIVVCEECYLATVY